MEESINNAETQQAPPDRLATSEEIDKAVAVAAGLAGDVIKRWYADVVKKDVSDIFPDGLKGFVGSIKVEKNGSKTASANRGWIMSLDVVSPTYRLDMSQFIDAPQAMAQIATLLQAARLYLQYAAKLYDLPNESEWLTCGLTPTPYGTMYLGGCPLKTTPRLGVVVRPIS